MEEQHMFSDVSPKAVRNCKVKINNLSLHLQNVHSPGFRTYTTSPAVFSSFFCWQRDTSFEMPGASTRDTAIMITTLIQSKFLLSGNQWSASTLKTN
jgi:hypothetical protein